MQCATGRPYKAASVSHLWPSVTHRGLDPLGALLLKYIFFVIVFGCNLLYIPSFGLIYILGSPNGSHFRLNCRFGVREIQFLSNFQIRVSTQFTLNGRAGKRSALLFK